MRPRSRAPGSCSRSRWSRWSCCSCSPGSPGCSPPPGRPGALRTWTSWKRSPPNRGGGNTVAPRAGVRVVRGRRLSHARKLAVWPPACRSWRAGGDGLQWAVMAVLSVRTLKSAGGGPWLEGLGDWAWPGRAAPAPAAPLLPAAWVPALPLIDVPAVPAPAVVLPRRRRLPRALRLLRLVVLLLVAGATFLIGSGVWRPASGRDHPAVAGSTSAGAPALSGTVAGSARPGAIAGALEPPQPPRAITVSTDTAGSTIASVTFRSRALGRSDTYLVYLPPGYASSPGRRYPVLYLLHGYEESAASFLTLGLEPTLDRLIARHRIAPMIAVMLQGAADPAGWQDTARARYRSYVLEVTQLTDRVLRTIPNRASRGIAGYSLGGFGAMNVALSFLRSYSVAESWEGYFANLSGVLAADRPLLRRLPLHVFVYDGTGDTVTNPAADAPWAAALRAAGAWAHSALYPGRHDFTTLERHLAHALIWAGQALHA